MPLSEAEELELLELEAAEASASEQPTAVEEPSLSRALGTGFISGVTSGLAGQDKPAEQAHPIASGAANIAGSIAQGLVLPAKKIFDAGTGAVEGYTSTEGSIPQKLGGAAIGAGLGLTLGVAGRKLGGIFKSATKVAEEGIEKLSEKSARNLAGVRAVDIYKASKKGSKLGAESVDESLSVLRKEGLFNKGVSPQAIQESAMSIKNQSAQNLDGLFQQLDEVGLKIDTDEIASALDEEITKLQNFPRANLDLVKQLQNYRSDLINRADITPTKLRELTQIVGDSAFGQFGEVKDEVAFDVWKTLKNATNNVADQVSGPLGQAIKAENKKYSSAVNVLPGLARKAAREEAKAVLPIIGKPLQSVSEAAEGVAAKAVLGSPEWLGKNIGKLGKYEQVVTQAASRGPRALAATVYRLNQTDPEFQKLTQEKANGE